MTKNNNDNGDHQLKPLDRVLARRPTNNHNETVIRANRSLAISVVAINSLYGSKEPGASIRAINLQRLTNGNHLRGRNDSQTTVAITNLSPTLQLATRSHRPPPPQFFTGWKHCVRLDVSISPLETVTMSPFLWDRTAHAPWLVALPSPSRLLPGRGRNVARFCC